MISGPQFVGALGTVARPVIEFEETAIGVRYQLVRDLPSGNRLFRSAECVVPNIILVPNIRETGDRPVERDKASEVSWAVPVDDTHVMGLSIVAWPLVDGEPDPAWRPGTDTVTYDERGQKIRPGDQRNRPYEDRQRRPDDMEAQEGQRAIAIHDLETLVSSDRGIVMLRRMLERQIEAVQRGRDPMNIVRDPGENHAIETHAFDTVRPKETADLASVW